MKKEYYVCQKCLTKIDDTFVWSNLSMMQDLLDGQKTCHVCKLPYCSMGIFYKKLANGAIEEMPRARPPIDENFMDIANVIKLRSPCLRRQVGAVLVRDKQILSTGYNGPPAGFEHCTSCAREVSGAKLDECFAVHAEENCIIQAALHGVSISGGTTIYTTTFPCVRCLRMLINAGVNTIVYETDYDPSNIFVKRLVENIEVRRI